MSFTSTLVAPHHFHKYMEPDPILLVRTVPTTIICYQDDCYEGKIRIDRKLYPPELIGPKLRTIE